MKTLEELQWRASLNNPGDRDALLANFDAIVPRSDGDSELDALFVEPGTWRQGFGRALVEHCCQMAKVCGASALHVVGNPHAEGFYEACGFKIVRQFDMPQG